VRSSSRKFEVVPGLWKLGCALAVLFGHNLVALLAWRPDDRLWSAIYHAVQFFSPLHFFFFSGFIAASVLLDPRKSLAKTMVSRGIRIYVLIFTALVLGLGVRLAFQAWSGVDHPGDIWPLAYWSGGIDWTMALRHLNPIGFADHVSFNYAVWYLYQEFRMVLLFPLFRWILLRPTLAGRMVAVGTLLVGAALLEFLLWSWFPMFRSSPFQTLGFSCIFLVGALVWMEQREGGILHRLGVGQGLGLLAIGIFLSLFESMGIRPPLDNPIVLLVPVLLGQAFAVAGLVRLARGIEAGPILQRACDASVGIYIVHPPIHMIAIWWAIRKDSLWPVLVGIVASLAAGWLYHIWIEVPSQRLARIFAPPPVR